MLARAGVVSVVAATLAGSMGCGAAAPPAGAEYPSLVLPARHPPREADPPSGAPAPDPAAAKVGSAGGAASPGLARPGMGSAGPTPATGAASGGGLGGQRTSGPLNEHGDLPDPEPLSQRAQWSYPVVYERGQIRVGEPEASCLPRPQPTPRRIGRFAFELWLGRELIDRVRFDFPLLASEEPPTGPRRALRETPRFAPGAHVSVTLRVPASDRATTARIFDRATGDSIAVTWPPRSTDGVTRPHPCPPGGPGARAGAKPPSPTDAGR